MDLDKLRNWSPPDSWTTISTIDAHTGGEPLRIILDGFPDIQASSILELRRVVRDQYDHLRTALMFEPRGHADMYGCLVTPPMTSEADFGVLFMHNEGYSSMCGHGIIAVTTAMVESGAIEPSDPETEVRIDTPSGLVTAFAISEGGRVQSVRFHNVPSFVVDLDNELEVPGVGPVTYDLAFGGAFYAYVQAEPLGLELTVSSARELIHKGMLIKNAVMQSREIEHPFEPDLSFLYGTIFIGPPLSSDADSRNVCIFAEGEVDRSPTGTGVSGRVAIHHARGELEVGRSMTIESIVGSRFGARVVEETRFGSHQAIIPEVTGSASITGKHEFVVDPDDPLGQGFIIR